MSIIWTFKKTTRSKTLYLRTFWLGVRWRTKRSVFIGYCAKDQLVLTSWRLCITCSQALHGAFNPVPTNVDWTPSTTARCRKQMVMKRFQIMNWIPIVALGSLNNWVACILGPGCISFPCPWSPSLRYALQYHSTDKGCTASWNW